jgi:hypothetical protein
LYPNCARRSSSPSSSLFEGRRSTANSPDDILGEPNVVGEQ